MAGEKQLVIRIKADKSAAEAAGKEYVANEKARNKELLADARRLAKETADAEKAGRQAAREVARAAKDEATRLAREQAEVEKTAARDKAQAHRTAIKEIADADRQRSAAHKQAIQEQTAAAKQAAKEQAAAAKATAKEQAAVTGAIEGTGKAFAGMALQLGGVATVGAAVSAAANLITQSFEKARDIALEAVNSVVHYREAILELAALKGQIGQSSTAVKEDLAFRSKTLQTAEASRTFQLTALGVGESSIDNAMGQRLISKDDFRKAMEYGGAFQAAEGGSAEAHAQLVGLLPSLIGRRTTGEEVFQKEAQLYKIFQPGGASYTSLANQYSKLAPLITSGQYDPMEAAALLSAFSTTNKEGAGENFQQFTRATLGGIGRMRGASIEGAEKQGEYLKSIGVTDQLIKATPAKQLPFAIANLVTADMNQQREAAAARGEEFNPYVYLRHKGYGNEQDLGALLQYQGLLNTGALQGTFMPLASQEAMPTFEQAMKPVKSAQRTDPAMLERSVQLGSEQANVAIGTPLEYYGKLQRRAYDRLKARGETGSVWGSFEDYQKDWLLGGEKRLDKEIQDMFVEEMKGRGMSEEQIRPHLEAMENARSGKADSGFNRWATRHVWDPIEMRSNEERAAIFGRVGEAVGQAGGDVLPGGAELARAAQASLEAAQQSQDAMKVLRDAAAKLDHAAENLRGQPNLNARPEAPRR